MEIYGMPYSFLLCIFRGIEWSSLVTFMSFASTSPNSNGLVKNEIVLTDIQTGRQLFDVSPIKINIASSDVSPGLKVEVDGKFYAHWFTSEENLKK